MSTTTCPSRDELFAYLSGGFRTRPRRPLRPISTLPGLPGRTGHLRRRGGHFRGPVARPARRSVPGGIPVPVAVARLGPCWIGLASRPIEPVVVRKDPRRVSTDRGVWTRGDGHGLQGPAHQARSSGRAEGAFPRPRGGHQAIARFEREMKAIGQLDHRHIVRAYDAREIDGTPTLVMEYVEGLDLGEIVRRVGPLRGRGVRAGPPGGTRTAIRP